MDYKNKCVCGCSEFFNQKFKVYRYYDTQTFRVCKQCGTVKMLACYYDDEKKEYQEEWIKK